MPRRPPRPALFPTRRSSDLDSGDTGDSVAPAGLGYRATTCAVGELWRKKADRKSTRLNSSHRCISYAVFCLKKKKDQCVGLAHEERPTAEERLRRLAWARPH